MRRNCCYRCRLLVAVVVLTTSCATIPDAQPKILFTQSTIRSSPTPFQPLPPGTDAPVLASPPAPTGTPGEALEIELPGPGVTLVTTSTLTPPIQALASPEKTPPGSAASYTLWVAPDLPAAFRGGLTLPSDIAVVDSPEETTLRLEVGTERPVSYWVYALAAPFPTIPQGVASETLLRIWRGEGDSDQPLLMDENTYQNLSALWGVPAPQGIQVQAADELLDYAWNRRPAWAILPFEALEPRWKVLEVDGQSPVHKDFDPATYPLTLPISLSGDPTLAEAVRLVYGHTLAPPNNRDPGRMTVLVMTGVTALVRATAFAMERKGVQYPAGDIGPWLQEADLTHISNEVPFAEDCPYPDPLQPDMRFCSNPRYIGLLESVGTDVVELTGDHFQDWGPQAMKLTLKLYKQRGWPYYGGGASLEEARQAITVEHNGNRLAFIGCNAKGGSFAQAGVDRPGAAACGYEYMGAEISRLRGQGYLPIATFQHYEYYTYKAQANQMRDFRNAAQAGAVIVSGSQAHQPQALEFYSGALIHYGLGNLFFDQYDVSLATRQGFIDRHVFYNGRHISTELLTILFIDYARPRPMTPGEREDLLRAVFSASGW